MSDGIVAPDFDAVVVGAGFAGIYALHRLRRDGFSARVYESASGVGGTWFHNRYPGCRCDVSSVEYSYSFSPELEQEWAWTERYPSQAYLVEYLNHVVDRFGLRDGIQLETRVTAASFDDETGLWAIETDRGDRVTARFLVTAVGCLSAANRPAFPGLDDFEGLVLHTGEWPEEEVDLRGKRVGVVGTGSSGVQVIPVVAEQAEHLYVFQRTAGYVVPARNHPYTDEYLRDIKSRYREFRQMLRGTLLGFDNEQRMQPALEATPEERRAEYQRRWDIGGPYLLGAYGDLILDLEANRTCSDFVREKIDEIVDDPAVAEKLKPKFPIGAKRLVQGTDYYETYNRDNVTLVDVAESPIEQITPTGLRTADAEYELDVLILATGYDAVTGSILRIDVRGSGGRSLRELWADGPHTYLGVAVHGFPNMFTITGPASPSVTTNLALSIEQHVDWIADCLVHMRENGLERVEPTAEAQDAWGEEVAAIAEGTVFRYADSWYYGANIPGKPRVFLAYLGGFPTYQARIDEIAAHGYEGFVLEPGRQAAPV
ncbi:MAG TPA: NAD(P)/FAD-dependent oxidoreductase [Solirubrobacteraceae bacterium]|nr:NAD(P)/FAD-dependent oxidoreductase [Solirubrobacteraceae bacterium]